MAKKKSTKKNSRARHIGAAMFGGTKGTALAAVSGGALYYGSMFAGQHSQTVRDRWYLLPAALIVGGHFAKKSRKLAGPAVAACTIGGYQLAQNYAFQRQRPQQQQQAAPQIVAAAAAPELPAGEAAMVVDMAARRARGDSALVVGKALRR